MSTHAPTAASAAALPTGRLALCLLTLALSLPGLAPAQAQREPWKGAVFRPSSGTWRMEPTPAGGLDLVPDDPSAPSSVELLLPPATPGALQGVELQLAALDPLASSALAPGATLEFSAFGAVGGQAGHPLGTLRAVKQPNGGVAYEYDFSALGVSTVTVEFFDGPTSIAVYPGVPVGPGGSGPLFTPNCTCPTCPASWWCCWLGAVYYSNGVWYNAWNCAFPIDWFGNSHNANRVAVTPENPSVPVGELEACTLSMQGFQRLGLTDLALSGFTPAGASYCSANPNSTGQPGFIMAVGSNLVARNELDLYAFQLPDHAFGYFIVSPFQAFVPNAGGTQGNLCVGLSTGRFRSQLANTGTSGNLLVHVDLTALPQPNGTVAVLPGQTWNFQCWHRDANPGATSNFTSAYSIVFQ